ncbi:hypothetical protein AD998_11605 [bacterium 336/3]|nr:hypothetical protein AD998_11605 [bacterium 336/3]
MDNTINNKSLTTFYGGKHGIWQVISMESIIGKPLDIVEKISIESIEGSTNANEHLWKLKGISSNMRYTNREEKNALDQTPSVLGKPEYKYATLIPIKKSEQWWLLTQDERRNIFEEQSKHIHFSLKYLTEISRKLYHSRDIGEEYDFLTWFEFKPESKNLFDELVSYLRETEEWKYITRETDIRLERSSEV